MKGRKMKRWMQWVGLMAVIVGLGSSLMIHSMADSKKSDKSGKDTAKHSMVRGDDTNVKSDEGKNDKSANPVRPPKKGGDKTRGAGVGVIHIDNQTKWTVRMYNNGEYVGTVAPYGDLYYNAENGTHRLYAKAPFPDPSDDLTWGPRTIELSGGFTWTLQ